MISSWFIWRADFLAEGYANGRVFAQVRENYWKYTETIVDENAPELELECELYDLNADPCEMNNLFGDASIKKIQSWLRAWDML